MRTASTSARLVALTTILAGGAGRSSRGEPPATGPETTTTVPETTSTTSDIPPEWTVPGGGGINP